MNDVSRPAAPEVIHAPPSSSSSSSSSSSLTQTQPDVQQQQLHRPVCLRPTPMRPRTIASATATATPGAVSAHWIAPTPEAKLPSLVVNDTLENNITNHGQSQESQHEQQSLLIEETPAEALYRQAHETGVDLAEVHRAVRESHEWHWKWSDCRQETPAHGYNNVGVAQEETPVMEASGSPWSGWGETPDDSLRGGAKNPSPVFLSEEEQEEIDEEHAEEEDDARKRVRDGEEDQYGVQQPPQKHQSHQNYSSFVAEDHVTMSPLSQDEEEDDDDGDNDDDARYRWIKRRMHHNHHAPPTVPALPVLVRPIPLRIARPAAPQPQFTKDFFTHTVPSDILQDYRPSRCHATRDDNDDTNDVSVPRSLSPLTAPSHSTTTVSPIQGARYLPELGQEKKEAKKEDHHDDDDDDESMLSQPAPTRAQAPPAESTLVHLIEPEDDQELVQQQQQQQQQQPPLVVYRPLASRVSLGSSSSSVSSWSQDSVVDPVSSELAWRQARDGILHALAANGGDPTGALFDESLAVLEQQFAASTTTKHTDTRSADADAALSGMWLTLTKPMFFGCLGTNEGDDPMYTLGRMTFDMFAPTNLICSLQGNFNSIERVCSMEERQALLQSAHVPKAFREEVQAGESVLRTYNIIAAFTIEPHLAEFPDAPNKDVTRPIRGIMTTYGYTLPDPDTPNRHSVWITGGRIEPNNDPTGVAAWKRQFTLHPPRPPWGQQAKLLAVKWLMGAQVDTEMASDGSLEYTFSRPLGGHGLAFVDTIYVDETLRIVRGHRGTIFVFKRLAKSAH